MASYQQSKLALTDESSEEQTQNFFNFIPIALESGYYKEIREKHHHDIQFGALCLKLVYLNF